MFLAVSITVLYIIFVWLVFFKFKWLKFNIAWGIVSFWVGVHILLLFVISLRFFQPYSTDGHIIHHTIQLVPRLTEPTLLTEVLVEANTPVKAGQPLFQFDKTIYQARVDYQAAQLAAAKQNVLVLQADVTAAQENVRLAKANEAFAAAQKKALHGSGQARRRPGRAARPLDRRAGESRGPGRRGQRQPEKSPADLRV